MGNVEEKEIKKSLIRKIKKIYEGMKMVIRSKKGLSRYFKMQKGVRQGCVMNLILFNLYIADLDKEGE